MTRASPPLAIIAWAVLGPSLGCIETAALGTLPPDGSLGDFPSFESPDAGADAPVEGGDGGTTCTSNADCPEAGTFCQKLGGTCDGAGACVPKPTSCPPGGTPVCDCTQALQPSECAAWALGRNVATVGVCPMAMGDASDGPPGTDP